MPLFKLQISADITDEKKKQELLMALSKIASECTEKPEHYLMAIVETTSIIMSGTHAAAAFAEVRSIGGLNKNVTQQISHKLCALLQEAFGITPDRTYINFTNVTAENWGWKGGTFV
jgi:phenylpyruvate tautomerase PptA (4-oxalocrotonate tautomerase family)